MSASLLVTCGRRHLWAFTFDSSLIRRMALRPRLRTPQLTNGAGQAINHTRLKLEPAVVGDN
jgi:hypothetical protein